MTLAEQATAEFHNSKVTISIVAVARRMGARSENVGNVRRYTFPDDSRLEVTGRGASHKIKTFLL